MARRILLDTHVWLWMNGSPARLRSEARTLLEDSQHQLFLSAASTWEIGLKHQAGKLDLPGAPTRYLPARMAENGIRALPIDVVHTLRAASLPAHHKDPFDRLLVAQAQIEELEFMTADPILRAYDVVLIPA